MRSRLEVLHVVAVIPPLLPVEIGLSRSAGVAGLVIIEAELNVTIGEEIVSGVSAADVQRLGRAVTQGHTNAALRRLRLGAHGGIRTGGFEDRAFLLIHLSEENLAVLEIA